MGMGFFGGGFGGVIAFVVDVNGRTWREHTRRVSTPAERRSAQNN